MLDLFLRGEQGRYLVCLGLGDLVSIVNNVILVSLVYLVCLVDLVENN